MAQSPDAHLQIPPPGLVPPFILQEVNAKDGATLTFRAELEQVT